MDKNLAEPENNPVGSGIRSRYVMEIKLYKRGYKILFIAKDYY